MNTNNIKNYAPKAREAFIEAMHKQAARYGISAETTLPLEIKGDVALIGDQVFPATIKSKRDALALQVEQQGFYQTMEFAAYSWFNRFCALRYMELKDFLDHGRRVLSHPDQANRIELIDDCLSIDLPGLDPQQLHDLKLDGTKDEELYHLLILAQCRALAPAIPFFEVAPEQELLLPNNLTKTDSLIKTLVAEIPEEDWDQVEIMGWLYQFYISEKKDEVIGKVVKSEDIPAATQLFTPNWIVQYLVQNSLGRQWLQTYPDSSLKEHMPYYIEAGEQTPEVEAELQASIPESLDPLTIKVLDPAAGSGHILIEAYNVLKRIYEERGFRSRDIPQLILENNLFGLDIDDRAGQLASFSLLMMARQDDRRLFTRLAQSPLSLNVVALQESQHLDLPRLWQDLNLDQKADTSVSYGLFEEASATYITPTDTRYALLASNIERFEKAKTFGSLIDVPHEEEAGLKELLDTLRGLADTGDTVQVPAAKRLLPLVHQAWILAQRYDAVVANPPYMGSKYQTAEIKKYLRTHFKDYDKDLFSAFIVRNLQLAKERGQLGFMTPFVWMFISSYEKLRHYLISEKTITSLVQLEYSGFDGATVPICTFTLENAPNPEFKGGYVRLSDFKGAAQQGPRALEIIQAANAVGK